MVYIDSLDAKLTAFPCTEEDQHDGTYAYKIGDGQYLSLDLPSGTWKFAAAPGPWEKFKKGANALVIDIVWDGKRYCYLRPFVEVR